jgi:hypothetical protein
LPLTHSSYVATRYETLLLHGDHPKDPQDRSLVAGIYKPMLLRLIFGSNRTLTTLGYTQRCTSHLATAMLHRKILIRKSYLGYA